MITLMARPPSTRVVLIAFLVSGAGHVIHNLGEFPVEILLGWETLFPVAVTVVLAVAWFRFPGRAIHVSAVVWATIVLVFGGGSVIPFAFLPFVPDQSAFHYATHVVYAATQVPLLWVGLRAILAGTTDPAESTTNVNVR